MTRASEARIARRMDKRNMRHGTLETRQERRWAEMAETARRVEQEHALLLLSGRVPDDGMGRILEGQFEEIRS